MPKRNTYMELKKLETTLKKIVKSRIIRVQTFEEVYSKTQHLFKKIILPFITYLTHPP